jgi:hypothetical protein
LWLVQEAYHALPTQRVESTDRPSEVPAGESGPVGHEFSERALEDDPSTSVSSTRTQIDDQVSLRHNRLMMLVHNHGLPGVDKPVEQTHETLHVGEMQSAALLIGEVDDSLQHGP